MPYRTSYIIKQMARGRPMPTGSPEPELHRAIEQISPRGIDDAIQHGAQVNSRDGRGRTCLHALFDQAIGPKGQLRISMDRFIFCCRSLMRENADVSARHPATGQSVLYRTSELADHPQAAAWLYFWRQIRRGNWAAPDGRGQLSPLAAWHEKANDAVRERLPPLPQTTIGKDHADATGDSVTSSETVASRKPKP
jgi:hypothetical protein